MGSLRFLLTGLAIASALAVCAVTTAQDAAPPAAAVPTSPETNPAVLSALERPRTKPGDYLQAVVWLLDLGRPELAAPIFQELQALNLTDSQRAQLVREHGSRRMLQIARSAELPGGAAFAESCLAAAAAEARNPERLKQLLDQLSVPSAEARLAARTDLAASGMPGVLATAEAFGRETDGGRRAALADALAHMQPLSIGPLVALFETNNHDLRADVMSLLARLGVRQMLPLIAAEAVREPQTVGIISGSPGDAQASAAEAVRQMIGLPATPGLAERLLVDSIDQYRRGAVPFAPDENGRITLWQWNGGSRSLEPRSFAVDDARTIWMARLALALAELRPDHQPYLSQFLVLGIEADGLRKEAEAAADESLSAPGAPGGPGQTPPLLNQLLAGGDNELISQTLTDAMKGDYPRAAALAAEVIGARKDASVLSTHDGRPAPLVAALDYPDRRVRFAALRAIMTLDPTKPFPGSSRVPAALGYFAGGTGVRRAVVALPTMARATALAGQLAAAGIEAEAADNGYAAVRTAGGMADLEMVLVDMNVSRPGVRELVYQLRAAPTTGRVPIALLAGDGTRLQAARRLAGEHRQMIAAARPSSAEALTVIVDRLANLAGRDAATAEERADQAAQAMTWLARLLDSDRSFYQLSGQAPVIEASLYRLEASPSVLAALVALGTPTSQQTLADYASHASVPIEGRQRAASAFQSSVDRHGLLLAPDDIVRQYDRYNASARADAVTQEVLGSLLDAIESRRPPGKKP